MNKLFYKFQYWVEANKTIVYSILTVAALLILFISKSDVLRSYSAGILIGGCVPYFLRIIFQKLKNKKEDKNDALFGKGGSYN